LGLAENQYTASPSPIRLQTIHHHHPLHLAPLEPVTEIDNETDTETLFSSPLSNTASPTTPNVDGLRLSADTISILRLKHSQQRVNTDESPTHLLAGGQWQQNQSCRSNRTQPSDERTHGDCYYQYDEHAAPNRASTQASDPRYGETRNHDNENDSHESDNIDAARGDESFISLSASTRQASLPSSHRSNIMCEDASGGDLSTASTVSTKINPIYAAAQRALLQQLPAHNSVAVDEEDNEEHSMPSTVVNPSRAAVQRALIAQQHETQQRVEGETHAEADTDATAHASSTSTPSGRRPSQIEYDTDAPSPANTNLTFDMSIISNLNETLGQQLLETVLEESVESAANSSRRSTETPVLDRYRLVKDDQSPHGFVVLPNERRQHTSSFSKKKNKKTEAAASPSSPGFPSSGDQSSTKKNYRRTPHPKKNKQLPSTPRIDENAPLNLSSAAAAAVSPVLESGPQAFVPLTRTPRTDENRDRTKCLVALDDRDRRSLAPSLLQANGTSPPTVPTRRDSLSIRSNLKSPPTSTMMTAHETEIASHLPFLRPVTKPEFDVAPRIIHLQVTFDEVEAAAAALNDAIRQALRFQKPAIARVHVADSEVHRILRLACTSNHGCAAFEEDRKRKSLLFALCHFGRLRMRRPTASSEEEERELVYDVVG